MKRLKQKFLGCSFDAISEDQALAWSRKFISGSQAGYVATVNVAILMMMRQDERLKKYVENASLTVADGQPIIWLSKLLRKPLPERVAGIDLFESIAKMAARENKKVYLLGATDQVLSQCERQLCKDNPNLIIAGRHNGYFSKSEAYGRAKAIKDSQADILFVAMGVPRQDYFIEQYLEASGVKLAIGLGGSFDVIGGVCKRAPRWMQNSGMEWFFRMMQEPKRLAKRYATTNSKFIYLGFREILNSRSN